MDSNLNSKDTCQDAGVSLYPGRRYIWEILRRSRSGAARAQITVARCDPIDDIYLIASLKMCKSSVC